MRVELKDPFTAAADDAEAEDLELGRSVLRMDWVGRYLDGTSAEAESETVEGAERARKEQSPGLERGWNRSAAIVVEAATALAVVWSRKGVVPSLRCRLYRTTRGAENK